MNFKYLILLLLACLLVGGVGATVINFTPYDDASFIRNIPTGDTFSGLVSGVGNSFSRSGTTAGVTLYSGIGVGNVTRMDREAIMWNTSVVTGCNINSAYIQPYKSSKTINLGNISMYPVHFDMVSNDIWNTSKYQTAFTNNTPIGTETYFTGTGSSSLNLMTITDLSVINIKLHLPATIVNWPRR